MSRRLLGFFALAYAISWALWAPAVLSHWGWIGPVPVRALHLAGALGPMIAAAIVGRRELTTLLRGCVPNRLSAPWLGAAVLLPATVFLVSVAIVSLGQGAPITWAAFGRSEEFPELSAPVFFAVNLAFYGFGEEVGWRGFALPLLQSRRSALTAALLIALGWAGWHLPLFVFSPGLSALGVGGTLGWFMSLALGSIVQTWLFNSSRGSICVVAVFHASLDVFFMSPVAPGLSNVMGAVITIASLALIPLFGRQNLSRHARIV